MEVADKSFPIFDTLKKRPFKKASTTRERKLLLVCKTRRSHYSTHFQKKKKSINTSFLAYKPKIRVCKSCLVIKHVEETSAALSVTACWVEEAASQMYFGTPAALPAQHTAVHPGTPPPDEACTAERWLLGDREKNSSSTALQTRPRRIEIRPCREQRIDRASRDWKKQLVLLQNVLSSGNNGVLQCPPLRPREVNAMI